MRPTKEKLSEYWENRLFPEITAPPEREPLNRRIWRAYDPHLPDGSWIYNKKKIDIAKVDCAGMVYFLYGWSEEYERNAVYIGANTTLQPGYKGSGAQLERVFPDRDWMIKEVLEFVDGSKEDVFRREYEYQMHYKEEIIVTDNWHDQGIWLNLQIVDPDGGDSHFHHSIVRAGFAAGNTSPMWVKYVWDQTPTYFASQKELRDKYGWSLGRIPNWLRLDAGVGNTVYAEKDCPFELRKRNPAKTWRDRGIENMWYA